LVETKHFTTMDKDLNYRSVKTVLGASSSADEQFTVKQIQKAVDSRDQKKIAVILKSKVGCLKGVNIREHLNQY